MKKNYLSLLILLYGLNFSFGQILTESFNDDSGFTKSESFFSDEVDDYFGIYDPSGVSNDFDGPLTTPTGLPTYTGNTNLFLVGEDLDGDGGSNTKSITWPNLDISGYTNLNLSVDLAADTGGFDTSDQILLEVNIDGSGYTTLMAFTGTAINTNATNGSITLNTTFQTITENIVGTGNLLDLRLTITVDAANEEFAVDEIILDGTPPVSCAHEITSFTPTEGPAGTKVTINGNGFTQTSSVNFNGIASSSVQFIDSNTLIAIVADGTSTGSISVTESGCTETGSSFTIINFSGSCSSPFSDLIISEVYDSNSGSLGYIEIYNGTGTAIDLSDYEIDRYATLTGPVNYTYIFPSLTINDGQVLIGKVSTDPDVAGVTSDFTFGNTNGFNEDDRLELVFSATNTVVDDWHDDSVPGGSGFSYLRNTNITGPNPNYDASEWTGNGTEDVSDLGNYSISSIGNPSITGQPASVFGCNIDSVNLLITAAAGNSGTLTYQWKFNDGSTTNWQDVTALDFAPAVVSGETSNNLSINGFNLDGYQFYCEVTENATCSIASNTAIVSKAIATWDGTNWLWSDSTPIDTMPTTNASVIIDGNYDTATGGVEISFEACDCTVNNFNTLTIANDDYVLVQNNVVNNGTIDIATSGALVQVDNAGTYTLNPTTGTNILSKTTSFLDNWYDYTYWSSPLENSQIEIALFTSNPQRRYFFNAAQFNDILIETDNTGTFTNGNDDIDDEGNDWTNLINGPMTPGRGYATMHTTLGFIPNNYTYYFEGNPSNNQGGFNTGNINLDIYIRPEVTPVTSEQNYNNWNFIGNPYPSAIDATIFFEDTSSFLEGAIYLWSHVSNADPNASGNENANFSQDDYAVLNYVGGVATGSAAPNDPGNIPNGYIASGQGFFVIGNKSHAVSGPGYYNEVVFNNRMRVTGNNTQFYRTSNSSNKLWVNLTSDTGIFSQILVAYTEGATDDVDAMSYDAPRNLSTKTSALLSSIILNSDKKFAIQAKAPNSLSLDETIPLGFYSNTNQPTIYTLSIAQLEGEFMTTNTIYLVDNLNNTIHNLTNSNYSFTSDAGDFNNRFEIVFTPEVLSINDTIINANELIITELHNGEVQIKVSEPHTIEHVEILDILGRQIYNFTGNTSVEVYNLSKLSNAAYVAKVTLSNGQVISKKAVKQR